MSSKCPICRKPTETEYRPFCSRRCADVDLQRWLVGAYAVPASDDEVPTEDSEED
jgi:endogenous inhibitor of DNA gyrase (YacG/DUF329 family)